MSRIRRLLAFRFLNYLGRSGMGRWFLGLVCHRRGSRIRIVRDYGGRRVWRGVAEAEHNLFHISRLLAAAAAARSWGDRQGACSLFVLHHSYLFEESYGPT